MNASLINLIVLAAIAVMILGPKEVYRLAHKLGKWMREVQKMSEEFTAELTREADALDEREKSTAIERNAFASGKEYSPDDLKNYHGGDTDSPGQPSGAKDALPDAAAPAPTPAAPPEPEHKSQSAAGQPQP